MSSKIKNRVDPLEWDIRDPRPTREALGFEPAAVFLIEHRGHTHTLNLDKLIPMPEGVPQQFTSDRLVQMLVSTLDIVAGYVPAPRNERRAAKGTIARLISSISEMTDSRYSVIKVGEINAAGTARLRFQPTNCRSADELRHAYNRKFV